MNKPAMMIGRLLLAVAGLVAASTLSAQIRIGQTAGHTGTAAAGVKDITAGAKLYLDAVNAAGGVGNRTIELVTMDDQFDPKLAVANARQLIDQGVLALFLTRGTPHNEGIMPLLAEHRVPLIAPSTGAMVLHKPVHPWVFNVRATYQREAERAIEYLFRMGMSRVGIIQVDDSFGTDAATGALKGFTAFGKAPVLQQVFARAKPDFSAIITRVKAVDPQAILFIGTSAAASEGINQLRSAGSNALMVTLSNNASAGFVQALGSNARGVVVTQVFPYEGDSSVRMVKEAQDLARARGIQTLTPSMVEGFAAAKVLVEALRRASKDLTREGIQKALNSFKRVDIGGLEVTYGPDDHTGLDYADLSVIASDGRFRR